jgi:polyphosphate glucokinase
MDGILGVDIGGTGVKAAPVDVATGALTQARVRHLTPKPATPEAVARVVADVAAELGWSGSHVGAAVPAVVRDGVTWTAANIDESWIGVDAGALLSESLGASVEVLNDADAAGLAEMHLGEGRGRRGVVLVVTLGTGIGTALFVDGVLVPNTELGHIEVRGHEAERRASGAVRDQKKLSWSQYAQRVDEVLHVYERLLWPDLFVIGGGLSKRSDKFLPLLTVETEVVAAGLLNEAGIVGAAMSAHLARS